MQITKAVLIRQTRFGPVYRVRFNDGRSVTVTVPPSACRSCGGEGCARCAKSQGYEPSEAQP